jgi:hypothetical protein
MRPLGEGLSFARMICRSTFHRLNVCSRARGKSCPALTTSPMDLGVSDEKSRAPNVAVISLRSVVVTLSRYKMLNAHRRPRSRRGRRTMSLCPAYISRRARCLQARQSASRQVSWVMSVPWVVPVPSSYYWLTQNEFPGSRKAR